MALILMLALVLVGYGAVIAGVYILAGLGWSLLAFGACCLLLAGVFRRGLRGSAA